MRLCFSLAAALVAVGSAGSARADGATPLVVSYVAPPECASAEAFHALLTSEVTRAPNPDRPWRFSVSIRRHGDYVGTLRTETSSRELRAPTCDDVTAALALVIATAEPMLPATDATAPPSTSTAPPPSAPPTSTAPPPSAPPTPVPPPPPAGSPRAMTGPTGEAPRDRATTASPNAPAWRFGLRALRWSDGSQLDPTGVMATASVEMPWGFPKMLFEVGAGALVTTTTPDVPLNVTSAPSAWLVVNAQACPLDVPIGETGLSVLGCGQLAVGLVNGVAGWGGGGGRLRWQSPWRFYVEGHFNGLYGTRVEGIPALMDFGGSLGLRI